MFKVQIGFGSFVYKIPYRRARAWPSARASKGILHTIVSYVSDIFRRAEKTVIARSKIISSPQIKLTSLPLRLFATETAPCT